MLRGAYSRLFASPRWPGWRIAIFYGLMCLLFSRELVPFSVAWVISDSEGTTTTVHERIVAWNEPSPYQYRWLVPMMGEGIHRVTGLPLRHSFMILAVLTMWLVLVSLHMLLRRRFSPAASLGGGLILLMAYVAINPHIYYHPYDILHSWCIVMAVEGILRRSARVYIAALALLCLTKWEAAAVAAVFLAPAWLDGSVGRSLRWRAILGGLAAVAIVLGGIHIPLIGIDLLFRTAHSPFYMGTFTNAQFVAVLLNPRMFADCAIYLLPALVGVFWGYRLMGGIWRRLLWYPLGIFICGVGAKIVIWETRTYYAPWVVFVPFLLAALFDKRAKHAPVSGQQHDLRTTERRD